MSTSFQVYPCNLRIPEIKKIAEIAKQFFEDFLKEIGITRNINIECALITRDRILSLNSDDILKHYENGCVRFWIQDLNYFCFVNLREDKYKMKWSETQKECTSLMKSYECPYYWNVEGRNLLKGFVAGAIAKCTEGFVYSCDGAWDINLVPALGDEFLKVYPRAEACIDMADKRWWEDIQIDLIDKYQGCLIYPKFRSYEINRTPLESRKKYIEFKRKEYLIFESDMLKQLYLSCPVEKIKCTDTTLNRVFEKLDWLAWSKFHFDFFPTFEEGIDNQFKEEFYDELITINTLDKIDFNDIWVNDNFYFNHYSEKIRKLISGEDSEMI